MSGFNLSDRFFRTQKDGTVHCFPFGAFGRGYVLPSEEVARPYRLRHDLFYVGIVFLMCPAIYFDLPIPAMLGLIAAAIALFQISICSIYRFPRTEEGFISPSTTSTRQLVFQVIAAALMLLSIAVFIFLGDQKRDPAFWALSAFGLAMFTWHAYRLYRKFRP